MQSRTKNAAQSRRCTSVQLQIRPGRTSPAYFYSPEYRPIVNSLLPVVTFFLAAPFSTPIVHTSLYPAGHSGIENAEAEKFPRLAPGASDVRHSRPARALTLSRTFIDR